MKYLLFAAVGLLMTGLTPAQAAEAAAPSQCAVNYTRTACPGQEAISYKKCDGQQSCVKYKKADSLAACQAKAVRSCRNRRLNITKNKVISATWMGRPIKSASGKDDFCLDYEKRAEEFNRCDVE